MRGALLPIGQGGGPELTCALQHASGEWFISTNGHALVAFRGHGYAPGLPPLPELTAAFLGRVLDVPPPNVLPCPVGELRARFGDPVFGTAEPCEDCEGSGRDPEADGDCKCARCRCESCDGDLAIETPAAARAVLVRGKVFDANLIALALRMVPDVPNVAASIGPTGMGLCVHDWAMTLRNDDVVVVVMGLCRDGVWPVLELPCERLDGLELSA